MTTYRMHKADQRIYCTVNGCEFNSGGEHCQLDGIRIEGQHDHDARCAEESMCASYREQQ